MSRAEKISKAQKLREAGLTYREIGERLGVSTSTVGGWFADPHGSKAKARKLSYGGKCESCGRATHGHDGREAAPTHCSPCSNQRRRYWTRERIIDKMQRWQRLYGSAPSSDGWASGNLGLWPTTNTVQGVFGSWSEGLRAAGLEPRRVGRPPSFPEQVAR